MRELIKKEEIVLFWPPLEFKKVLDEILGMNYEELRKHLDKNPHYVDKMKPAKLLKLEDDASDGYVLVAEKFHEVPKFEFKKELAKDPKYSHCLDFKGVLKSYLSEMFRRAEKKAA